MRPLLLLPPVLFFLLAGLFFFGMNRENPDALPAALAGQAAPALELDTLAGFETFGDDALRSPGVKLVNFWASWCAPCRVEHPNLVRMAEEGIRIYGVNYKDDPAKAIAFLQDLGNPFAGVGTDASGRTALDWGVYGVPETYVIDSSGTIITRFAGPITSRVLEETIRPAMATAQ